MAPTLKPDDLKELATLFTVMQTEMSKNQDQKKKKKTTAVTKTKLNMKDGDGGDDYEAYNDYDDFM